MFTKASFLLLLILSFSSFADIEIPQSIQDQIVNEVIAEYGYFDAVEIENRKRLWKLAQPQPRVSAEQTDSGSCNGSCAQSGGNTELPTPRNVKFKGRVDENSFNQNLVIKWKRPIALPDDSDYQLKNYKIILSKDGNTYEKYKVKAKFKNNGKPKKKQKIKLRNIEIGDFNVQVRASYKLKQNATLKSSLSNKSSSTNSEWSDTQQGTVKKFEYIVSNLPVGSALKTCLLADPSNTPNENVSGSTSIFDITNIQCAEQGLQNSDMNLLSFFDGLLVLDIKKNYAVTNISQLGDLPHLEYLNLNWNSSINLQPLADDSKFDSLESLFISWMGLNTIPEFPESVTLISLVGNLISDNNNGYFPDYPIDSIDVSNNKTSLDTSTIPPQPIGALALNDQFLINLANNNVSIKTFKARHTVITELELLSGISGLENLEIVNAELNATQRLRNFSGFCSLKVNSDKLETLKDKRPVQVLDLSQSLLLKNAHVFRKDIQHDDVLHAYQPVKIDLTGDAGLNCKSYYDVLENTEPRLFDFSTVPSFNLPNGETATMPSCPTLSITPESILPDFCVPTKVADTIKVYEDTETARRYVTWEGLPQHVPDYDKWGISHFKISTFLGPQLLTVHFQSSEEPYVFTEINLQPDRYVVQACTEHVCGYEREFSGVIEKGLTQVNSINQNWSENNEMVSLEFSYPNNVFEDVNGKGAPDYFKITPTFTQPSGSIAIPDVEVSVFDGDHIYQNIWQSIYFNTDQFIGTRYSIQACRDDIGCGVSKIVNLERPQVDVELSLDALTGVQASLIDGAIVLSWDNNNLNQDADYIKVEETQPQMNHGYKAIINSIPNSGVSYKSVTYYSDELNKSLKINRVINGQYTFDLSVCHRDRENGDVCSDSVNVSQTISKVGPANYPNVIEKTRVAIGKQTNSSSYWNGYPSAGNSSELFWFKFQYSNNPNTTKAPDYFHFSNLSNNGIKCVQKYKNPEVSSSSYVFNALDSFVIDNDTRFGYYQESRAACVFPSKPGDWAVSACFSGIGCGESMIVNMFNGTVLPMNVNDNSPSVEVEVEELFDGVRDLDEGGPGGIVPGHYWNPQQSGTGWQFHWATHIDGRPPEQDENRDFRVAYDLVAYWFAYTRKKTEVLGENNEYLTEYYWTPTWYKAKLKRDRDTGYYDGSLLSYKKHQDGTFSKSGVGSLIINLDDSNPENFTMVLDIDFDDAALTSYLSDSDFETPCQSYKLGQCTLTLENINIKLVDGGAPGDEYVDKFGYGNDSDHYSGVWARNWNESDQVAETALITTINRGLEVTWVAAFDNNMADGEGGDPFWAVSQSCGETCSASTGDYFSGFLNIDENQTVSNIHSIARGFNPLGFTPNGFWNEDSFTPQSVGKLGRCFKESTFDNGRFYLNLDVDSEDFEGRNVTMTVGDDSSSYEGQPCNTTNGLSYMEKIAGNHFIGHEINSENTVIQGVCNPGQQNGLGTCSISFDWYTNGPFKDIEPFYRKIVNGVPQTEEYQLFTDDNLCRSAIDSIPNAQAIKGFNCLIDGTNQDVIYEFQLRKKKYVLPNGSDYSYPENWVAIAQSRPLIVQSCPSGGCQSNVDLSPPYEVNDPEVTGTMEPIMQHYPGDGSIPGSGGVSGGAATYNLPINVPPGINGMTPELSINYSSKAGMSTMGVGWSVSAGGSIYRCPKTLAQDNGKTHSVNFTNEDRLCLNGQRLVRVNPNSTADNIYWENNAEYRTEIESFTKVVAKLDNNSDKYFEAFSKSGQISRYELKGLSWLLSHESDVHGNVIEYNYLDGGLNEHVLEEIVYTGRYNYNENTSSESFTSGNRVIKFDYTLDQDQEALMAINYNKTFSSGQASERSKLLTGINTEIASETVRAYRMNYESSQATEKILLSTIEESAYQGGESTSRILLNNHWSAGEGEDPWLYLKPEFAYSDLAQVLVPNEDALLNQATISSDYNGDGIKEYVIQPTANGSQTQTKMLFLDSAGVVTGSIAFGDSGDFNNLINTAQPGDLNQDGYTDYLYRVGDLIHVATWKNGQGRPSLVNESFDAYFEVNSTGISIAEFDQSGVMTDTSNNKVFLTDLTQDGKQDIVILKQPQSDQEQGFGGEKAKLLLYKNQSTINADGTFNLNFSSNEQVLQDDLLPFGDWEGEPDVTGTSLDVYHWDHIFGFKDWNGDGYMDFRIQRKFYTNARADLEYVSVVTKDRIVFIKDVTSGLISTQSIDLKDLGLGTFDGCRKIGQITPEPCYVDTSTDTEPRAYNQLNIQNYFFTDVNSDGLDDFVYYNQGIVTYDTQAPQVDENVIRNWKVRLNQGGDQFFDGPETLFDNNSIESTLSGTAASDNDQILLPQGNACQGILAGTSNASEAELKMCHPIFRARFQLADVNVDGRPELLYPNPNKLYFNHCGYYGTNTTNLAQSNRSLDFGDESNQSFSLLDQSDQDLMLPTSLRNSIYESDRYQTCLAGGDVCPVTDPQRFTSSQTAAPVNDVICSGGAESMYSDPYTLSSAVNDKGVYGYDAIQFSISGQPGTPILDVAAVEMNLYTNINSPALGDANGDGLLDSMSRWGCIDESALCTDNSIVDLNLSDGPGSFVDESELKALGGAFIQTLLQSDMPDLLSQVTKPTVNKTYQWSHNSLSQLYSEAANPELPYYSLPSRQLGENDAYDYLKDEGGDYFFFNSSMYVVSKMQQTTGLEGVETIWDRNLYGYQEAVYNNQGRGFQGFREITVVNQPNNLSINNKTESVSTFHQIFPLAGKLEQIDVSQNVNTDQGIGLEKTSLSQYFWEEENQSIHSGSGVFYNPAEQVVQIDFRDDGSLQSRQQQDFDGDFCSLTKAYDDYGNVLCNKTTSWSYLKLSPGDQELITKTEVTTENEYDSPEIGQSQADNPWWVDKISSTQVTTSIEETGSYANPKPSGYSQSILGTTQINLFYWHPTIDRQLQCQFNVGGSYHTITGCSSEVSGANILKNIFTYDDYGHASSVSSEGEAYESSSTTEIEESSRDVITSYALSSGYFANTIYNEGLTNLTNYEPTTGQIIDQTDPNGVTTEYIYDEFNFLKEQNVFVNKQGTTKYLQAPTEMAMQNCILRETCVDENALVNQLIINLSEKVNQLSSKYNGQFFSEGVNLPLLTYKIETKQPGSPKLTQWLDQNNQTVLTKTQHALTSDNTQGTSYVLSLTNHLGQTEIVTEPFDLYTIVDPEDDPEDNFKDYPYFTLNVFDQKGRQIEKHTEVGQLTESVDTCWRKTEYHHDGLTTEIDASFNGAGCAVAQNELFDMSRSYDASGKLRQTVETKLNQNDDLRITDYWYDSAGNLYMVRDAENNIIKTDYDDLGRKKSVNDPNMGIKNFRYNAFGEVIFSQDANQLASGSANYFKYDQLGRMVELYANTSPNLLPKNKLISYKDMFDYCPGKTYLCSSFRYSNEAVSNNFVSPVHAINYLYDDFARTTRKSYVTSDAYPGFDDIEFNIDYHYYDNISNPDNSVDFNYLKQTIYTSFGRENTGYSVVNEYDVFGNLTRQRENPESDDVNNPNSELMRVTGWNLRGQPTGHVLNNNLDMQTEYDYYSGTGQTKQIINGKVGVDQQLDYTYDAWGNIKTQSLNDIVETFNYDNLHRMRNSKVGELSVIEYDYDVLGNLIQKSDFADTQNYGAGTAGPNAITESVISTNLTKAYYYDAAGNRIEDRLNGIEENTYEYDANNLMTYSHKVTGNQAVLFRYGSDNQRYFKLEESDALSGGDGTIEATFYAGPHFELIRNDATDETEMKFHVTDYLTVTRKDNLSLQRHFLQKDRLGSTTQILDKSGEIVATKGYDAFGKPRDGDTWAPMNEPALNFEESSNSSLSTDITKRGFTGHEHLDNFELIHMNGRMYDFNNGRFLSVDPFIQGTTSQAINPYSYIHNNPLSGVDPTGYLAEECGEGLSCEELASDVESIEVDGESGEITAVTSDGRVSLSSEQAGSVVGHIQVNNGKFNANALGSLAGAATGAFNKTIADINPKARGNSNLAQNIIDGVKGLLKSPSAVLMLLIPSNNDTDESADLFRLKYFNEGHGDDVGDIRVSSSELAGAYGNPGGPDPDDEDNKSGPVFKTDSQAAKQAKSMGYRDTGLRTSHETKIFRKGKSYITRDRTGHKGGAWKQAKTAKGLESKQTRLGTYSKNLKKKIGD